MACMVVVLTVRCFCNMANIFDLGPQDWNLIEIISTAHLQHHTIHLHAKYPCMFYIISLFRPSNWILHNPVSKANAGTCRLSVSESSFPEQCKHSCMSPSRWRQGRSRQHLRSVWLRWSWDGIGGGGGGGGREGGRHHHGSSLQQWMKEGDGQWAELQPSFSWLYMSIRREIKKNDEELSSKIQLDIKQKTIWPLRLMKLREHRGSFCTVNYNPVINNI